jgi:hypothetical protein
VWWYRSIIPVIWEAEIRKVVVQGQHRQKKLVRLPPISKNKLGVVACTFNVSYQRDRDRRPRQKVGNPIRKITRRKKPKGSRSGSSDRAPT